MTEAVTFHSEGDQTLLSRRTTLITGNRSASPQGMAIAADYAAAIASSPNRLVVVQMFSGISAAAAEAVMGVRGKYAMVIAAGLGVEPPPHLATVYEHASLILTPHEQGLASTAARQRDSHDLTVALCDEVLVVESQPTGSAMDLTWRCIQDRMRVYAVPGPAGLLAWTGGNNLIATGDARAVTTPAALLAGDERDAVRPRHGRVWS